MKEEKTRMLNKGNVLAHRLEDAGIEAPEKLVELGAKNAFLAVKAVYPQACISSLFALEGAIQNARWHSLSAERKKELKEFYDSLK